MYVRSCECYRDFAGGLCIALIRDLGGSHRKRGVGSLSSHTINGDNITVLTYSFAPHHGNRWASHVPTAPGARIYVLGGAVTIACRWFFVLETFHLEE